MSNIPSDLLAGWDIVVIDDEPDSLEVARYILDFYGANVHTAINGKEGIVLVEDIQPRFVISDISMPEMDGWGFIEKLKGAVATQEIPVIALTAHAMKGDKEKALEAGFFSYLTKPLTAPTFMDELVALLMDIPKLAQHLSI